jgi:hypothetical protein
MLYVVLHGLGYCIFSSLVYNCSETVCIMYALLWSLVKVKWLVPLMSVEQIDVRLFVSF